MHKEKAEYSKICELCKIIFITTSKNRRFCTKNCASKNNYLLGKNKNLKNTKKGFYKKCIVCDKEIYVIHSRKETANFCSIKCAGKQKRTKERTQYIRNCPECNKEIFYKNTHSLNKADKSNTICNACSAKNKGWAKNRKNTRSWNLGLTKETDERVLRQSENVSKSLTGRKLSKQHVENITKFVSTGYRFHNGYYTKSSGECIYYNSGLELKRFEFLESQNVEFKRCKDYIEYIDHNKKNKYYNPDLIIDNGIIEEIKGYPDADVLEKHNAAKIFYSGSHKYRVVILKSNQWVDYFDNDKKI